MFLFKQQPGRTITIDGEEYLFFSGYSYLGMSYVPAFIQLVKEGIDKYGVVFPSSRISNTRLSLYRDFENYLARFTGMDDSISFSSGYLSGQVAAAYLSSHPYLFVSPEAHPAVTPAGFNTDKSFVAWKDSMLDFVHKEKPGEIAIIADSVNTGKGKINDFSFLTEVPASVKIICLVDDSHGIGILGLKGEGIRSRLPQQENIEYILSCSLSKAFHLEGGFIACSSARVADIKQQHAYTGSTAIIPAFMHSFLQAEKLYQLQREKLLNNINSLAEKIKGLPYVNHHCLPIFVLHDSLTEDVFRPYKIAISSFGYPNPDYDKNNRVVLSALHTEEDISVVANCIRKLY
ncbi:MAG: pyridoxal phosphate-dependent aminotransferase family protein [Sphingobacteriales bacterium]|nr:pyridoxal phosphate-dependent aminotransferase family protein [Sphingobacteriales bacterium]